MKKNNTTIITLSILLLIAVGIIFWQNLPKRENNISNENQSKVQNKDEDLSETKPEDENKNEPKEESLGDVRESIIGSWQSTEDELSTITFQSSGEVIDVYGGGAINEAGTYQIFDSLDFLPPEELGPAAELNNNNGYLRQSFGSEDYYYSIIELDEKELVLFHLPRGNRLEYKRIGG